jgi:hypothetical protein
MRTTSLLVSSSLIVVSASWIGCGSSGGVCATNKPLEAATGAEWDHKRSLLPGGGKVCGVSAKFTASLGKSLRVDYSRSLHATFVDVVTRVDELGFARDRQTDPGESGLATLYVSKGTESYLIELDARGDTTIARISDYRSSF